MSRRERAPAETVMQRLLLVLPLASRDGGANVEATARDFGVEPQRLLRDLEEVESRSYYLPAGLGDGIQLTVTREHLTVWTTGEFQRPVRLTARESIALELALRLVIRKGPKGGGDEEAGSSGARGTSPSFEELRGRIVSALRRPAPEEDEDPAIALAPAHPGPDPLQHILEGAVRNRTELRILYRAPGREAEVRRVGPLVLAHAEGRWYLLARDLERDGLRSFRADRVLEAEETGAHFTPYPGDESALEEFFQDGRILDGSESGGSEVFEAVVEYSPRIARWVREQGWDDMEPLEDEGVRIRHRVLDSEWLLRHVLSYGPDARIVKPRWMGERVVEAVERIMSRLPVGGR